MLLKIVLGRVWECEDTLGLQSWCWRVSLNSLMAKILNVVKSQRDYFVHVLLKVLRGSVSKFCHNFAVQFSDSCDSGPWRPDSSAMNLLLAVLALMILVSPGASAPCPRACSCPQPTEVHCTFRSLAIVPPAVPKHVKRMNLGLVKSLDYVNTKIP